MKGDGRRRRTASEDGDDLNLKRFKGAGNSEAGTQNCGDSSKTPEEGVGIWAGDSERVSSSTKTGNPSEGTSPSGSVSSPNTNSSIHLDHSNASSPLYPALVKENGRLFSSQGAADSTSNTSHPPNPPPLKPAPSPFSTTSFPSLGQMPVLVHGAPAPKASPSPQPDREDAPQSAFSKTAALVSPGPVTISWSQDSRPSVSLSSSMGFSSKAPTWGGQTEVSSMRLMLAVRLHYPGKVFICLKLYWFSLWPWSSGCFIWLLCGIPTQRNTYKGDVKGEGGA